MLTNEKLTQDLITGTDIFCITATLPADTQGIALPRPFPYIPDTFIDVEKATEALPSSSPLISNTREMTQARPSFRFIHLTLETRAKAIALLIFVYKVSWMEIQEGAC